MHAPEQVKEAEEYRSLMSESMQMSQRTVNVMTRSNPTLLKLSKALKTKESPRLRKSPKSKI